MGQIARKTGLFTAIAGLALALGGTGFVPMPDARAACLVRPSALAAPSVSCAPWPPFQFKLNADFSPMQLPRRERVAVAAVLQANFGVGGGGESPPALKETVFEFDRDIAIGATGFPACPRRLLDGLSTKGARESCRGSMVGDGVAHVVTEDSLQEPTPLVLTLFNGGVRGGTTTLLVHSSVPGPRPTPIVTAVKIEEIDEDGPYGLRAASKIPEIANGEGSLLDFTLRFKRRVRYRGDVLHYALARCPKDRLQVRMSAVLEDGTRLIGTILRPCSPTAAPAASSAG